MTRHRNSLWLQATTQVYVVFANEQSAAIPVTERDGARQFLKSAYEVNPSPGWLARSVGKANTRRSGSGNGSGLRKPALTIENIAAFTPIPSANVAVDTSVSIGLLIRERIA